MATDPLGAACDAGEDMGGFFDFDNPAFPNRERVRIGVELPRWMVAGIDAEAARLGTSTQEVIEAWVAEKLGTPARA